VRRCSSPPWSRPRTRPSSTRRGALLNHLAAAVEIRRLNPAEPLSSQCGDAQQRLALDRLRARIGDDALLHVLDTNDDAVLRDRVFPPAALANMSAAVRRP
jgi:hypothetical protein